MSFTPPHILIGDFMHCPKQRVASRVKPLASDNHRFDCPACGLKMRIKEQPVSRELEPIPMQEARSA